MSKRILLLGGSAQQLVAIRAAKELGLYTVLCDYLPDNPGQYEVDKFYQTSTTDVEAVYKVAQDEKVDGILAYASDPAALPAAIVAERLGLPTNPSSSVAILGVKHLFRDFLQKNGFACPQNVKFSPSITKEEFRTLVAGFQFPIIVKPTDSSGSKGVTKLDNLDNISAAISWADNYSRNKTLIAEEFISRGFPNVIGGDVFVWDGEVVVWGEMTCLRDNEGKGLIPVGKMKPTGLNDKQIANVHKEIQRLVSALGFKFGQCNLEILLDEQDNVHFLELGPRAGGNMIPIQLSDAYGIDLVKANVMAAMGMTPHLEVKHMPGAYMTHVLHSYKAGKYKDIVFDETIDKHIYRKSLYKKAGDEVEIFDGAGKALGIIFLHFDTEEQMRDMFAHIYDHIDIQLQ